jgi:hypothetical protein
MVLAYGNPRVKDDYPKQRGMQDLQVSQNEVARVLTRCKRSDWVTVHHLLKKAGTTSVNRMAAATTIIEMWLYRARTYGTGHPVLQCKMQLHKRKGCALNTEGSPLQCLLTFRGCGPPPSGNKITLLRLLVSITLLRFFVPVSRP